MQCFLFHERILQRAMQTLVYIYQFHCSKITSHIVLAYSTFYLVNTGVIGVVRVYVIPRNNISFVQIIQNYENSLQRIRTRKLLISLSIALAGLLSLSMTDILVFSLEVHRPRQNIKSFVNKNFSNKKFRLCYGSFYCS